MPFDIWLDMHMVCTSTAFTQQLKTLIAQSSNFNTMNYTREQLEALAFPEAPALDPRWVEYYAGMQGQGPAQQFSSVLERQPVYAEECRDLYKRMTQPGARDYHLSQGISKRMISIPSSIDGYSIPVMQLGLSEGPQEDADVVIVYLHGGGLCVGEADSEELSCRRLLKSGHHHRVRLYSVGYRLMPTYPASTCLSDCRDAFSTFSTIAPRVVLVGSSSGGQMATAVSQAVPRGSIHGMILRGTVTADAASGKKYIPERFRHLYTSCSPTFVTALGGYLKREIPRDGLAKLPLEAEPDEFQGLPRTWIQVSTNDTLYSDGLCYAMALKEAGVEVRLDVVQGWPHTFWLKAPQLVRALEADEAVVEGLRWLLGD